MTTLAEVIMGGGLFVPDGARYRATVLLAGTDGVAFGASRPLGPSGGRY